MTSRLVGAAHIDNLVEIERRFLVDIDKLNLRDYTKIETTQGYLSKLPTVRVRHIKCGTWLSGFLTVKGEKSGPKCFEAEYDIPYLEAKRLIEEFCPNVIEKDRYVITHDEHEWHVDIFKGANEGLVIAEIELSSEDEDFAKPPWITHEITGDINFYNLNLVDCPFTLWE